MSYAERKLRVLYLVYWGAAEPLGQSLVLPTVKSLARLGTDLTLVTFEKPGDLANEDEIRRLGAELREHGVTWRMLRYHRRPKVPATTFDFIQGCVGSLISRLHVKPDVVHARTFVGGLMGLPLATALRSKLIYHNEGFYPDEQVDAGVWKLNSAPHRFARFLERRLYSRADGIIALSNRAKSVIQSLPAVERKQTPVVVVPSCVDLDHFQSNPPIRYAPGDTLRLAYVGSVGGRYDLERVGRFVSLLAREVRLHFRIVSRSERGLVASMLQTSGLREDAWSMTGISHREVPNELAGQHVGLHFLRHGIGDQGGSPTKIGEYWAAGIPVVVTRNAGDTEDIIRRERVGIIIEHHTDEAYQTAGRELRALLADGELANRCRRAAETHYALEPACARQFRLYADVTATTKSTAAARASGLGRF